jgi:hypothetical protein
VLTHFEHLDLATLLKDLDRFHVGLLDNLDCHLLASFDMRTKSNQAELAFSESGAKLVKLRNVCKIYRIQEFLQPNTLDLGRVEIEDSRLVGRKNDLDRVEKFFRVGVLFGRDFLYERSSKTVHHSKLIVLLVAVAEDLIATKHGVVFFKSICFSF